MNESEACILSGRPVAELSSDDCERLCQMFIDWGVQNVVITLGARVRKPFFFFKKKYRTISELYS